MKNPGRFIDAAMDGWRLPLIASARVCPLLAAGLCVIAVLKSVVTDGSRDCDAGEGEALHRVEATAGKRSGRDASTAGSARALAQAFTLGDRGERESRVRDLLSVWAARDADAALSWVSALENSADRRSARSTVCLSVAEGDPRRAVTLALAHGADEDDDRGLLECLTMQWCEKECEAVVDWARKQPQGEWRDRLLGRVSFVLSKPDPVAAAQLVSGIEPGAVQDEAAISVLHQWALKDSSAALRWVEEFPEGSLRERALAEISNLRDVATSLQEVR